MLKNEKVLIMRCDTYNAKKIYGIIKEGMEELGVKPSGNILLKPNVVMAHPEIFPYAFTRKEFLDGVIKATKEKAENVTEIAVGERSGLTIPTRYNFKMAGYPEIIKKHGIKTYYFDETKQVPYSLKRVEKLRDNMFFPKPILDCDCLINLPKFKSHPWTRLTLGLKNLVGIQDDRHKLVDHNLFLEHKIADIQEVIQPRFIAIDAITAGQKMMLTPTPFDMGAIVMGTNACAVDTVGCHMVNVDPKDLLHLRHTSQRGFGPMDLGKIDVVGDFPLGEVQEKTKQFEFCMKPIDNYFKDDCNLKCTVGTFPEKHSSDYCWGGCPGALQEAMHILKGYYPTAYKDMKKIHYVVGNVNEKLTIKDDEIVIFAGKCTSWQGKIDGNYVKIKSSYKSPHQVDEKKTKNNDMIKKNLWPLFHILKTRKRYIHIKGCPISVGDHLHYISSLGKIGNPNFDSRLTIGVAVAYWQMRINKFLNRFK